MSNIQKWQDLLFGLQAQRRLLERDALQLGGALSLAARYFSYQHANVLRILTAPTVRHLLASEVGMGKTVQALMVLNALRLQRPELRTLILVPNDLVVQWRDELRARAHVTPTELVDELAELLEGDPDQLTYLAWPGKLKPSVLEPQRFDLVIVDEPQLLPKTYQERLRRIAPQLQSILLLTATPGLEDPEQAELLLSILEPRLHDLLRCTSPDAPFLEVLRAHEERLHSLTAQEQDTAKPLSARANAMLRGVYRRVLITRRQHNLRWFPQRTTELIPVEPLTVEVQRQALMWDYMQYLEQLEREFEPYQLAQRVARSRASLRQRVTYLRGHGHERGGLLAQVDKLLDAKAGDSRFDALCSLLLRIWNVKPGSQVVIAAGDNLTVDELTDKLEKLFQEEVWEDEHGNPCTAEEAEALGLEPDIKRLQVKRIRNQSKAPADMVAQGAEASEAASAFEDGEATLLIAAEAGSVGFNLQGAGHLIFYSIPWDVQAVEQWIGRVDRLGYFGDPDGRGGSSARVHLHVLVPQGLIDEHVSTVLQQTSVFEHSVSLTAAARERLEKALREAFLEPEGGAWTRAQDVAQETVSSRSLERLSLPSSSALLEADPLVEQCFEEQKQSQPLEPRSLKPPKSWGAQAIEQGMSAWLTALKEADLYQVRSDKQVQQQFLAYPELAGHYRSLADGVRVPLDHAQQSRQSGARWYFELKRSRLTQPPVREVETQRGFQPLYFLDHGSPLMESLLDGWRRRLPGPEEVPDFRLELPNDHPASELKGKRLLISLGQLHPRNLRGDEAMSGPLHEREADERLLMSVLPAQLVVQACELTAELVPVKTELVWKLLAPENHAYCQPLTQQQSSSLLRQVNGVIRSAAAKLLQRLDRQADASWEGLRGRVQERLHEQLQVFAHERWLERELEQALRVELEASEPRAPQARSQLLARLEQTLERQTALTARAERLTAQLSRPGREALELLCWAVVWVG